MNQTLTPTPLRLALVGYGAMGHEIERLAPSEEFEVVSRYTSHERFNPSDAETFDVAIEFSRPDAAIGNIFDLLAAGCPVVVGTTGWLDGLDEVRSAISKAEGRLVYASNFSIGVNLFFQIVRRAAALVNDFNQYDAAIHEIHHKRKADSPSGTALTAAGIILAELEGKSHLLTDSSHETINPEALHVTSSRVGDTPGTHTVTFDSGADTIEITHRARNRSGFALGALAAARWIVDQPSGLYRFEDRFERRS